MDRLAGGKFQRSGRGGGRAQRAHRRGRGPSAPAPAVVLRARRARKTPPPRRAPPHGNSPTPAPAHLRRPYGGCLGAQGGWGGHAGGAAAFGGRGAAPGPPPGLPNKRAGSGAKGPGPRSFRTLRVLPPPPSAGFSADAKKATQSPAFRPTQPRPVHHPEKGGSDREPLRGRLQPSRRAERGFFRRGAATE